MNEIIVAVVISVLISAIASTAIAYVLDRSCLRAVAFLINELLKVDDGEEKIAE